MRFADRAKESLPLNLWAAQKNMRKRGGYRWNTPSKYQPHQGVRECTRRMRQMQ